MKTLKRSFLMLMLISILLVSIFISMKEIGYAQCAEGWLSGWGFRKAHNITGSSSGAQTDYQIRMVVHYGSGSDSGEDVYLNSKCQVDFDDIRFRQNGTMLDYWIESQVDSDNAVFYVEIPDIPDNTDNATIYVYYNNTDVSTTSNGTNTFLEFDDYSSDTSGNYDLNGWRGTDPANPVIIYDGVNDLLILKMSSAPKMGTLTLSGTSYGENYLIEGDCKILIQGNYACGVAIRGGTSVDLTCHGNSYQVAPWNNGIRIFKGEGGGNVNLAMNQSYGLDYANWNKMGMSLYNGTVRMYVNDVEELSASYTMENGQVGFHVYGQTTSNMANVDNFRVRKYVYPEPTHSGWGSEESPSPAPPLLWSNVVYDPLPYARTITRVYCLWNRSVFDGDEQWWLETNVTGSMVNGTIYSFSGFPENVSETIQLPITINQPISFRFYANNSRENQTSLYIMTTQRYTGADVFFDELLFGTGFWFGLILIEAILLIIASAVKEFGFMSGIMAILMFMVYYQNIPANTFEYWGMIFMGVSAIFYFIIAMRD